MLGIGAEKSAALSTQSGAASLRGGRQGGGAVCTIRRWQRGFFTHFAYTSDHWERRAEGHSGSRRVTLPWQSEQS